MRVPASVAEKGLGIEIGAHTDRLWHLSEWSRIPQITTYKQIHSTEARVTNAFGGPIYISVPEGGRVADFVATVSGGVRAPRYVHHQTDLNQWRKSIRKLPAPWAEIESDKIILTVPSLVIRELDDPSALMDVWDRISDLVSDLAGLPNWRVRAERMVTDVQISYAVLHAGYPIMMYLAKAETVVSREEMMKGWIGDGLHNKGTWGFAHELGHNVQSDLWSFAGAVEPTANLFTLYVFEKHCNVPVSANPRGSKEFIAQEMATYNFSKPDFRQWKEDSLLSLATYVQMQRAFGWDAFKRVFAQYLMLPAEERPKSDAEKRDQWMVRFSRQVRRNLGPFFETWGIPTSAAARASIADLPVWMPEEMGGGR